MINAKVRKYLRAEAKRFGRELKLRQTELYLGVLRAALEQVRRATDNGVLAQLIYDGMYENVSSDVGSVKFDALYTDASLLSSLSYEGAAQHFRSQQVIALIKKYPFGDLVSLDPEAEARRKFELAEVSCSEVNSRVREHGLTGESWSKAAQYIRATLGDSPDHVLDKCDFGQGASYGVHGNATNVARKICAKTLTVTPSALPYALAKWQSHPQLKAGDRGYPEYNPDIMSHDIHASCRRLPLPRQSDGPVALNLPEFLVIRKGAAPVRFEAVRPIARAQAVEPFNWPMTKVAFSIDAIGVPKFREELIRYRREAFFKRVKLVQENIVGFVPKTAATHRSVAVEPLLNGFLQKGVDKWMRNALKRVGLDLSNQLTNCEWARQGSLSDGDDDGWVTIDLSAASDSISTEVVRHLLPYDWFILLDALRSKYYRFDEGATDTVRKYEKFASMGNGFCFPLETLLFAAVCHSASGGSANVDFRVYGDDIIVKRKHAARVLELLSEAGFKVNVDKTFLEGPFRESCGADFWRGEDVRPFTLDFALDSLQSLFKFLNLSRRNVRCSTLLDKARSYIMGVIPLDLQFVRPCEGPSDTGITVEIDQFMGSKYSSYNRELYCWRWVELESRSIPDDFVEKPPGWEPAFRGAVVYAALRGIGSGSPRRQEELFTLRRMTRTRVVVVSHGTTPPFPVETFESAY